MSGVIYIHEKKIDYNLDALNHKCGQSQEN